MSSIDANGAIHDGAGRFDGHLQVEADTDVLADHGLTRVANPKITEAEAQLFLHGNCGILAYRLARMNGWGMRIYGELDLSEAEDGYDLSMHDPEDPTSPYIGVEELWHAFAVRPDGTLVDVRGAHEPHEADQAYAGHTRYDYAGADDCDRLWNYEQWLGSQVSDFGFEFDTDEEELAHADHVAALVTEACGMPAHGPDHRTPSPA